MQHVSDWLEKLGMSEYAQCFVDNDIDFSILGDLTDQDLKDLGVASVGHRRKILRAIAELGRPQAMAAPPDAATSPPSALAPTSSPPGLAAAPTRTTSGPQEAAGERRYLTVMFCDLVDSTGISAQLDAEEWRDLVGIYLDAASTAVSEMGGYVARKVGDGLLALFGYPLAHENDPERATRAALSIQRALEDFNRKNAGTGKPELTARIGLETGPAVVDAAGEIYGDVANIAARVQALAEPTAVLITARVQRQVAGLFVVEERGMHTLKGVPEPTTLFRLVRASGGGRRSGQRNLTPLVGRDDEMSILMRRWERTRQGDGQLVMIVGEPGLGKSRLIEEFHSRLSDTPHTWVEWSCSQVLQNTPLHPITEWGRQRFGGVDVPAERRFAELESALAQVKLDPAENVPLVAPLLDIPVPKERVPTLAAEELRRRQLAAMTNWVIAGARTQPSVLAFEDLHWADPTTLDVLRGIAERGALAPLYVLATTRPEIHPPWGMRSHHGTISLAPLDRAQVRDMVAELLARHALARDIVEDVAARTGGVPLFVEEVTRLLLERGDRGDIQAIPPTLQQSLMARLDRLGAAREVAHIGSVIGRDFSYSLLRAVAGMEDAPLQSALEKLADADIVLVQGLPPESDYRFKHALIQDAAYENLLKSRRARLHAAIADALEQRFPEVVQTRPETVAHHLTESGLTEKAVAYWLQAGKNAALRSANVEAIAHLKRGMDVTNRLPTGQVRDKYELDLHLILGPCLIATEGPAANEAIATFSRARELCERLGKPPEYLQVMFWLATVSVVRGQLPQALEAVATLLSAAEARGDRPAMINAIRGRAMILFFLGRIVDSREDVERAIEVFNASPESDKMAARAAGQDAGVAMLALMSWVLWVLGQVDEAATRLGAALKRADTVQNAHTYAYAWYYASVFYALCGEWATAQGYANRCLAISEQHGFRQWLGLSRAIRDICEGALDSSGNRLDEVKIALDGGSYQLGITAQLVLLCPELLARDKVETALEVLDRGLSIVAHNREQFCEAELYRLKARALLLRSTPAAEVEPLLEQALRTARSQQARSFELRAAIDLARLWMGQGKRAEALDILGSICGRFSEGFDTADMKEARAALAQLQ
jgi:class 3 adenylate cyclase/tetratricopeptide (TPR) repeat protein